jgi:hypothetical protein
MGSLVSVLTAAFGLIELLKQSSEHLKWISDLPLWVRMFTYAGLAWFALTRILRGLQRKSRVQDGNALRIDPNNPGHLRGRDQEIDAIIDLLPDHPVIFLTGESGVGKSFLMKQGLIPALEKPLLGKGRFLPLYVENYGLDRDVGPARNLRAAFAALQDHLPPAVADDLPAPQQLDATFTWLDQLPAGSGKALIIFDQLDDYIAAHSTFLRPGGNWLTRVELIKKSGLWRRIDERLRKGAIQVLFINRSDETDANPTFSLHGPVSRRRLTGVPVNELIDLISSLGEAAASDPAAGWNDFRNALAEQIRLAKPFLPIRAHFILSALADGVLPYLHPRTLSQIGGIDGLEAAWVADRVRRLACGDLVLMREMTNLLLQLAEAQSGGRFKTHVLSQATISKLFPNRDDNQIDDVLKQLAATKILRRRSVAGTNASWALYHDYLAAIVHRAFAPRHQAEQWLKERAAVWHKAETPGEKWRRLLGLRELREVLASLPPAVLWSRAGFLAASLAARVLPPLLLVSACGVLLWQQYQRELVIQNTGSVLATLVANPYVDYSNPARQAVAELSRASWAVKRAALRRALSNEQLAAQWIDAREVIFPAMVGWDETGSQRRRLYDALDDEVRGLRADSSGWQLALSLQSLAFETLRPSEPKLLASLVTRVRTLIEQEPNALPWQLTLLKADSFWRIAPRDLKETARDKLFAQVDRTQEPLLGDSNFFLACRPLADVFDDRVFDRLVVLLSESEGKRNYVHLGTYCQMALPFSQRLVDGLVKILLKQEAPPETLINARENLSPICERITTEDARALAQALFDWIQKEKSDRLKITPKQAFDVMSKHFPQEDVVKWANRLSTPLDYNEGRMVSFFILAEIQKKDRLTKDQVRRATAELFVFLADHPPDFDRSLSDIAARFAPQFTNEERLQLIKVYADRFASSSDGVRSSFSLSILRALRPVISKEELTELWTRLSPALLSQIGDAEREPSLHADRWTDAAELWQDLPPGPARVTLRNALLQVYRGNLKHMPDDWQPNASFSRALAKFLRDTPAELNLIQDQLRNLFGGATKREDALSRLATWRAFGGLESRDAPALVAWLGEPDSAALIGGYSSDPSLQEALLGALGEIFSRTFKDRWQFAAWATQYRPELLKLSPPPRIDNTNAKAEVPVPNES